jgi:hypothetical protein
MSRKNLDHGVPDCDAAAKRLFELVHKGLLSSAVSGLPAKVLQAFERLGLLRAGGRQKERHLRDLIRLELALHFRVPANRLLDLGERWNTMLNTMRGPERLFPGDKNGVVRAAG